EKRALIAATEGRTQEQINSATGEREGHIQRSAGERQAEVNRALGEAAAISAVADASAKAIERIAQAINHPGGMNAVNLKVAEKYVEAISGLARTNNTLIVPANVGDLAGLVATAMQVVRAAPGSGGQAVTGAGGQAAART
ncbi:MAG: paraslipin, partial [Burkholderiaceae bacterium]|nr:paraslipin [Burkholderiaceae bacterium]